jgi:hypothetical protein
MVAGYAQRRRFAAVEYRDADQSFCPQFPWFRLRELIRQKCDEVEIEFEHAGGAITPETPELPAKSKH